MIANIPVTCSGWKPRNLPGGDGTGRLAVPLAFYVAALFIALAAPVVHDIPFASAEDAMDEKYDEKTEITVRGTIQERLTAGHRGMGRGRGPVILSLRTKHKSYLVVTAPAWHLERQGFALNEGAPVEVRGSRYFGRDGILYLIAREIRDPASSMTLLLRDSSLRPLWRGHSGMDKARPFHGGKTSP